MPTPVHLRATQPWTYVGTKGAVFCGQRQGALRHRFVRAVTQEGYALTAPMGHLCDLIDVSGHNELFSIERRRGH